MNTHQALKVRPLGRPGAIPPQSRAQPYGIHDLVTVMDDYSRFILAHKLQRDMISDSFIEVVHEVVDMTVMT